MPALGLKPKRGAKVFADLSELEGGDGDGGGFRMPKPLAPLVRPQHSRNPSAANGLHYEALKRAAPKGAKPRRPKPEVKFGAKRAFGRARLDSAEMKPELMATMRKTLSAAAATATATLRALGDLTPRGGGPSERWAKFWEPGQRCYYFVSSKTGESRWAASFDDDVMVIENGDGRVRYAHHATKASVEGPNEASVATGRTIWATLVDPVSGQVYYYSRLSGDSRWAPPPWMDYYDADEDAVYYLRTADGFSRWEMPAEFLADAEAFEDEVDVEDPNAFAADDAAAEAKAASPPRKTSAEDKNAASPFSPLQARRHRPPAGLKSPPRARFADEENAPENAAETRGEGDLNAILFSYTKRPKTPWNPRAAAAPQFEEPRSPESSAGSPASKRDSGASCPKSPDYVPTRKLRFGDTLVLNDLDCPELD